MCTGVSVASKHLRLSEIYKRVATVIFLHFKNVPINTAWNYNNVFKRHQKILQIYIHNTGMA